MEFVHRLIAWALRRRLVRAFLLYSEHRGPALADGITYRALFSVFAGVLLGFSFAALWLAGNEDAWNALIDALDSAVPGLSDLIDFSKIEPTSFTVAGVISILGLLGAAIGAIGSLRAAIRSIADEVHDDGFFLWVLLRNLLLALVVGGLLVASAVATFVGAASITTLTGWLGLSSDSPVAQISTRVVGVLIVLVLDTLAVLISFVLLSGVKAPRRALWAGAALGGIGLTVLQELSGLFVGGASSNPLLATFASLIALLLWFNLSAQVLLIASAYIVTGAAEAQDRVSARYGAATFAQRRVQQAERRVQAASDELHAAREAEAAEREKAAAAASARQEKSAAQD
ncbi:MAG: YihY/virulence factor BrkB family protein [Microbacterium sp.]|uniref:YihY/virulence factor BrkB family protein n=1 Tax=Microbacterium sp. TaxID=51671 RepID=UPI0039E3BDAA